MHELPIFTTVLFTLTFQIIKSKIITYISFSKVENNEKKLQKNPSVVIVIKYDVVLTKIWLLHVR